MLLILSLMAKMLGSRIRETFLVIRSQKELAAKEGTLNKALVEIGTLARDLQDGSSQLQNLRNQVARTDIAIARLKGQILADQAKRKALRLELKRIRTGMFDAAPRVAGLRRQLRSLPNPGGAGRHRRMLESDLQSLLIQLGRQAFLERVHIGILGTHYRAAQNAQDQVNRLEDSVHEAKIAEKAQRQEMKAAIKTKVAEMTQAIGKLKIK